MKTKRIFNTNKRIKLGIWGLGRGMSFYKTCAQLNVDVVAGCDYNESMRQRFLKANPGAFATSDADEFLAQDIDAVLLATFCTGHAEDAIRCLRAGKHVLSEVTAFFTMAEGVRLVEEVEKSGRVYNLAENYPFSAANSYLARKWKEKLFGELLYAEFEYVHETRYLQYTYGDGVPVQPGSSVHSWRSWLNAHYYCTHSLGPIMIITGLRPTQVVALPSSTSLEGGINGGARQELNGAVGVAPSLIRMNNGAVVRNLMGGTANDTHVQRIWGSRGGAEINVGKTLQLRLGGAGNSPKFEVTPRWDELGEQAESTGHGGGDFWVIYYFARQILTGEKAPWDIYDACDVTIPGILALRSAVENGKAYDIPDFRDKSQREAFRNDHWAQQPFDAKNGAFGPDADPEITKDFSLTITDLCTHAVTVRSYVDWQKVAGDMVDPKAAASTLKKLQDTFYPEIVETYRMARRIADAYPNTQGGRVLNEMLDLGCEKEITSKAFLKKANLPYPHDYPELTNVTATGMLPKVKKIATAKPPGDEVTFDNQPDYDRVRKNWYIYKIHDKHKDGLIYVRGEINMPKAAQGELRYGVDAPVKVWLNGKAIASQPKATNPIVFDRYQNAVTWKKGTNELVFAVDTNNGRAWGVSARAVPKGK